MYLAFDEWNVHAQPEKRHRDFEVGSPIIGVTLLWKIHYYLVH